ncbi:MAG: nitronate monooxygenase, partial [Planctomycetota bacterium]
MVRKDRWAIMAGLLWALGRRRGVYHASAGGRRTGEGAATALAVGSGPMTHPSERLVERLGIRFPVIQGGMTFGSDARLVAAVSAAGGLGTLGSFHYRTAARVLEEVAAIRARTNRPFAVNVPFFADNEDLVEALAREGGVRVFALGGWFGERVAALKEELGLTVLVSVNSPTVARTIEGRPYDVLIVQGNESGGANNRFTTQQLFDLLAPE